MNLTKKEKAVRSILIKVAQGAIKTHHPGLIAYSELWNRVSSKPWGRGRKSQIVEWISRISTYELLLNRPPLNELVVRKGTDLPGEPWSNIRRYHKTKIKIEVPYKSHEEAQEACWRYWCRKQVRGTTPTEAEFEAEEGFRQDRTASFRKRNAALILARKRKDRNTCQACRFQMKVNGIYIIDCHHTNPLGLSDAVRVTRMSQLVCLCPTCHRIAHTNSPPLTIGEIKSLVVRKCRPISPSTERR